jgi:hypothetical protein
MLSLERVGLGMEEERREVIGHAQVKDCDLLNGRDQVVEYYEEEETDSIQPLLENTHTSNQRTAAGQLQSPSTPSTTTEATIITPTSATESLGTSPFSESGKEGNGDRRFAGSSPSRKAPVGVGLSRKESKWRKSVMGLSEVGHFGITSFFRVLM